MKKNIIAITVCAAMTLATGSVTAEQYELLTGVNAGLTPGVGRPVFPQAGYPGTFFDGDRLAGTAGTAPATWLGSGTPLFTPNQFGSLSFMFRRGSVPVGGGNQVPVLGIDYLGGPLLDLDGDLGNGTRSLTPVTGQTAAVIPGSKSFLDLSFDFAGSAVSLNAFDITATNEGSQDLDPDFGVTVGSMAGTLPNGSQTGPINPGIDTRQGTLFSVAPGVTRIDNLGYEFWQDSIGAASSSASTLGTLQYLGAARGWMIERDANGNFPSLTGQVGTTLWPSVDTSQVGNTFNATGNPPFDTATIVDGVPGDLFGPGGLPLGEFGGDLGAYLDAVVIPSIDPLSQSFVYVESAGFGINNSFDPVFADSVGYDMVLIAQSSPIPEPATVSLLLLGGCLVLRRRRALSV